jgi:hypothetical protein
VDGVEGGVLGGGREGREVVRDARTEGDAGWRDDAKREEASPGKDAKREASPGSLHERAWEPTIHDRTAKKFDRRGQALRTCFFPVLIIRKLLMLIYTSLYCVVRYWLVKKNRLRTAQCASVVITLVETDLTIYMRPVLAVAGVLNDGCMGRVLNDCQFGGTWPPATTWYVHVPNTAITKDLSVSPSYTRSVPVRCNGNI